MTKESNDERTENEPPKPKGPIHNVGLQGKLVYGCLLFLFCTELVLSFFLYEYISLVEKKCVDIEIGVAPTKSTRRKRSPVVVLEDNAVTTADDAHVEFFDPKIRHELDERDKHGNHKHKSSGIYGADSGTPSAETENPNKPWVWLTSYSRIPVSFALFIPL